jgi:NDP-sugar pyrophosphorylase family protein
MYPTHSDIVKVSQDTTLTPSQKFHELFKNSKTTSLKSYIANRTLFQDIQVEPSLNVDQAEVVEVDADGQVVTFRYPDNTDHWLDAGTYITIEGTRYLPFISVDVTEEVIEDYFKNLLDTEDSSMSPFYRGFWVDADLQEFFLNSYPE